MEETRTCDKCHKEVAEANFALHETHCSRFLCVCPDCDEPVPQDQLSQHREEQHSQVKCSKCHKKMEQCHLSDHQSEECAERLRTCPFCELEVPWKDLREHSVVCGCRTELCGDCGRYVQLRDLPGHSSTCSAAGGGQDTGVKMTAASPADLSDLGPALDGLPSAEPESCHTRTGSFPHDHLDQHEQECVPAASLNEEEAEEEEDEEDHSFRQGGTPQLSSVRKEMFFAHSASRDPWGDRGDPDQISTCPHCHLALPLQTLIWHEVKCRTHVVLKHREA